MSKTTNKKAAGIIKLQVAAGQAKPAPPVGPALGQKGLNIMEFCKEFNARTATIKPGAPIPVEITYYNDKKFSFIIKNPPVSYYLKEAAKISKGSVTPGKVKAVGVVSEDQIKKIAEEKLSDMNAASLEAAIRMVRGTARSIGLEVT